MGRTWLYPLVGAGIGFLVGAALVQMMSGGQVKSDTAGITLFVSAFLAGAGAIVGAICGAVDFFRRK
jgi:hypothetical protein